MIDYEKLKQAHELAKKLPFSWYSLSASQGTGAWTNYYVLSFEDHDSKSHQYEFTHDEVDHLIEKLQELIIPKPEPKYKVGDEVIFLHHENIETGIIDDVNVYNNCYIYHVMVGAEGFQIGEYLLFPTRQELIEHQINYWQSMLPSDPLPLSDGGKGYLPPFEGEVKGFDFAGKQCRHIIDPDDRICMTCHEYVKPDTRCNQAQVNVDRCQHDGYAKCRLCGVDLKCQHESDGNIYCSNPPQNKCVKCGEFYR